MAKRIFLRDIRDYDNRHDMSLVRELEMYVDEVVPELGYSVQFWKDMELYGLIEAVMYLEQVPKIGDMQKVMKCRERIIGHLLGILPAEVDDG